MTSSSHKKTKIFVAMSGGVDSSVAAAILLEEGYEVHGVTMCFELSDSTPAKRPRCCGLESIEDARKVCRKLEIQHHVLNYGDALEESIIKNFVEEYSRGRTPNPCVRCNRYLKFERLFNDIQALGGTHLATGHYARIASTEKGWVLKKGIDLKKDQSYFLYGIPREILPFVLFPVGAMDKSEVRAYARAKGIVVAEKKESQDLCFVSDGNYQRFLMSRDPAFFAPGRFIGPDGKAVGEHKGVACYTIGQREGLGIALGYPAYVHRIDPVKNEVYVGPRELLLSDGLLASGLNLVSLKFSKESIEAGIKIRYNHSDIAGVVDFLDEDHIRVTFREPQSAVTPGQSVVFYEKDVLLGGAVIDGAAR
jgi:tRNA-uridine 2-sulfurtransferase